MKPLTPLKDKLNQIFERKGRFFRRNENGREEEMQQIVTSNIVKKGNKFFQRKVISFVPVGVQAKSPPGKPNTQQIPGRTSQTGLVKGEGQHKHQALGRDYENIKTNQPVRHSIENNIKTQNHLDLNLTFKNTQPRNRRQPKAQDPNTQKDKQDPRNMKISKEKNSEDEKAISERRRKFELLSEISSGKDKRRTSLGDSVPISSELSRTTQNYQKSQVTRPGPQNKNHNLQGVIGNRAKETRMEVAKLPMMFKSVKSMYQEEGNEGKPLRKIEEERNNQPEREYETGVRNQNIKNEKENESESDLMDENSSERERDQIQETKKQSRNKVGKTEELDTMRNKETDICNENDHESDDKTGIFEETHMQDMGDSQVNRVPTGERIPQGDLQFVETEYVEKHIDWKQNLKDQEAQTRLWGQNNVKPWNRQHFKILEESNILHSCITHLSEYDYYESQNSF